MHGWDVSFPEGVRQASEQWAFARVFHQALCQDVFYRVRRHRMALYGLKTYNTAHMYTIWHCRQRSTLPMRSSNTPRPYTRKGLVDRGRSIDVSLMEDSDGEAACRRPEPRRG
jgi:hypothetical protein